MSSTTPPPSSQRNLPDIRPAGSVPQPTITTTPAPTIASYESAMRAAQQQQARIAAPRKRGYGWSVLRVATIILTSVVLATYFANVAVTRDKEQRVMALLNERRALREEEEELKKRLKR
ncbi:hypothetical protein HDU86_006782 [Geranomyces michiganensis]|nr:hypothetical protein HDU86_006782 [Geranomyces michiganensis]